MTAAATTPTHFRLQTHTHTNMGCSGFPHTCNTSTPACSNTQVCVLWLQHVWILCKHADTTTASMSRVTYVYCGDVLLSSDGSLNQLLIPDALHPNKQGMEAVFKCLQPVVLPMLGAPLEDGT